MSDPEKVERLTDEQVAEALWEARMVSKIGMSGDGEALVALALLQVSADLSAAKDWQALAVKAELDYQASQRALSALQDAARAALVHADRYCGTWTQQQIDRNEHSAVLADLWVALSSLRAHLPEAGR